MKVRTKDLAILVAILSFGPVLGSCSLPWQSQPPAARTPSPLDTLADAQRRTERRIDTLAEGQRKIEEQTAELASRVREQTVRSQRQAEESGRRLDALAEKLTALAARTNGLAASLETLDRRVGSAAPASPSTAPPQGTAPPVSASAVQLLFAHSHGCSHCAYQRPIISEFERRHRDLKVTRVIYDKLNSEQRRLIEGTSGHPVMVFYSGKCKKQVVGETALGDLEKEYEAFKSDLQGCLQAGTERKTTTGSGVVCR